MSYRSVDDAIARANNSPFGLNAYVYGKCKDEMRRVAEQLEAGTVMTNETLFTHACPETPWGGVKMSGVGRVHSDDGLKDLCIAYHVNEEVLPTMKWSPFWQPYSNKMYKALIGAARMLQHSELGEKSSGAIDFAKNVSQLIRNR